MAAIAAVHSEAPTWEDTDWHEIVGLYDLLVRDLAVAGVALNRAVAVGFAQGPAAGLAALEPLTTEPQLAGYGYLAAARAGLPAPPRTRRRGPAGVRGGVADDRERAERLSSPAGSRRSPSTTGPDPTVRVGGSVRWGMPPRFVDPTDPSAPLVWRVPSWQPAVFMLFVCGIVALNLYTSPIRSSGSHYRAGHRGLRVRDRGPAYVHGRRPGRHRLSRCAPHSQHRLAGSRPIRFDAADSAGRRSGSLEATGPMRTFRRRWCFRPSPPARQGGAQLGDTARLIRIMGRRGADRASRTATCLSTAVADAPADDRCLRCRSG